LRSARLDRFDVFSFISLRLLDEGEIESGICDRSRWVHGEENKEKSKEGREDEDARANGSKSRGSAA
jgi:hypothetical protein